MRKAGPLPDLLDIDRTHGMTTLDPVAGHALRMGDRIAQSRLDRGKGFFGHGKDPSVSTKIATSLCKRAISLCETSLRSFSATMANSKAGIRSL